MKVLILINSLGAGGAERSMVEFAKFLYQKENVSVQFACLERRKKELGLEEEVEKYGIKTYYFRGKGSYRAKTKFFYKTIVEVDPDVIHSVLAQSNFILRFTKLFYNLKNISTVQSLVNTPYSLERKKDSNLSWQKFQLAKQLDKWTARITPNIFYHAITKEVLKHYKPLFKIKDNYEIIYRGRYENKNLKKVDSSPKFTLINVGRQEFAKGQIDILKALKHIRDVYGENKIYLQILGRPGEYSDRLHTYIEENKLNDQVELHGFVNDVEKRLVEADVFVFPSYYEGLGGALLEGFAARLPCICSNIPVLKEVVGDDNGALFCEPGDYKKLAENILKLYKDKELREDLGEYSFRRFQENFRMETVNQQMLEMYQNLQN